LKEENSGLELNFNLSLQNDVSPPFDDYEDMSYEKFENEAKEAKKMIKRDKPLLRRKSELPHDPLSLKAITDHKRADEFLVPQSDDSAS
jgi:serine/threonine-protein phosphatase 2A regulatory subunit B'